ncbi:hypothetical protein AD998_08170 [bacterium 336/3]|nr:hypothetical protein AD998_08170 [bacterium 336/3]
MTKINASLKTPKQDKSVIWFVLSDGRGTNLKIYSGITIQTKHWSKKNSCVLSSNQDAISINAFIRERKAEILAIYLDFKARNIKATAKDLVQALKDKEKSKEVILEKPTLWELWSIFLQLKKRTCNPTTYKKFISLGNHLKEFENLENLLLDVDTINKATFEALEGFLYFHKNLNTQSSSKYLQVFKTFLRWCVDNKHTINTNYLSYKLTSQPDTLKVILTDKELQLIREVNLEGKNYLHNARQLFILSCLTGLRYSDYSRIKREHLKQDDNGEPILIMRQTKTNDFVEIPLNTESEMIVKELIEEKIRPITNQKINEYLKELCKIAGINETFEIHTYKGKQKTITTKPKYELVTTHTGRRTFATTLLLKDIPAETVMIFTGHRDYKSFSKYVNIPKKEQIKSVRNALKSL